MLKQARTLVTRGLSAQRGITGLETTIILIAFVVVASVFAYTVLTAGIFSSEKGREAVNASLEEVRSSMIVRGSVVAYKGAVDIDRDSATTDTVDAIVKMDIPVAVALQGLPIDVTPAFKLGSPNDDLVPSGDTNTLVVRYLDKIQVINAGVWTTAFAGANDGDFSLEATERAVLTVWLVDYEYDATRGLYYVLGTAAAAGFISKKADLLTNFSRFSLEMTPVQGSPLFIEKVSPQSLNDVMNLR